MIWTIYNHGTGSYSGKEDTEIVTCFGNHDTSQLDDGKIINQGAGSAGDPHKLKRDFARSSTGQYSQQANQGSSNVATRGIYGIAIGGGVQDNVDNTLEFLKMLNLQMKRPTQINMLGWSRGAVTCIRLAYRLWQMQDENLKNIPINIFAVDPVAGVGHNTEVSAVNVTPNVKNYVATMATGEKRRFFKPIAGQRLRINDNNATRSWILPMPGHHADTAKSTNNIGKIVFNLAYRFLANQASAVKAMRTYRLSDSKAWKLYEEVMFGTAKVHETKAGAAFGLGVKAYDRHREAAVHVAGDYSFFPNYHAEMVFKGTYPHCYTAYFDSANLTKRNTEPWRKAYLNGIISEMKLTNMSDALVEALQNLGPGKAPLQEPAHAISMMKDMMLVG